MQPEDAAVCDTWEDNEDDSKMLFFFLSVFHFTLKSKEYWRRVVQPL